MSTQTPRSSAAMAAPTFKGTRIMAVGGKTISSLSSKSKDDGAVYLILDGGAQLHGCRLNY